MENDIIESLGTKIIDQEKIETQIYAQVERKGILNELKNEIKRMGKVKSQISHLNNKLQKRLREKDEAEIIEKLSGLLEDESQINKRILELDNMLIKSVTIAETVTPDFNSEINEKSDYGTPSDEESPYKKIRISHMDDYKDNNYSERVSIWHSKYFDTEFIPEMMDYYFQHEKFKLKISELYIPKYVYDKLFNYQKTGLDWILKLYTDGFGGILGDEMGLGKTIQIISFISSLHISNKFNRPVLLVCPATLMQQWLNEFHIWYPPLRIIIVHSLANMKKLNKNIFNEYYNRGNVLITTYEGLRMNEKIFLEYKWDVAILDEGHKIRNPDAEISLVCKQIKCHNRFILSGTPIQNNLRELWSLFDFVYPRLLGTLPVFEQEFSMPIRLGGYANATNFEVRAAYQSAVGLKGLIDPYLLRRLKKDVKTDLPKKTEQVVFCKLTEWQLNSYKEFLASDNCNSIIELNLNALYGIDILRKICNHPDLPNQLQLNGDKDYGASHKSGKTLVLLSMLEMWKKHKKKTLVFCQTKQMQFIIQKLLHDNDYKFIKMSGDTAVSKRMDLVDEFNNDPEINVFLLTTKVGGLGLNLTSASRVVIFDPDWNPSTDMQARERAWRIGQLNEVNIYRLITAGTIEEKIYHKQIYKQLLSLKILENPNQKRLFDHNSINDLFSLPTLDGSTKTSLLLYETKGMNLDSVSDISQVNKVEKMKDKSRKVDSSTLSTILNISGLHSTLHHDSMICKNSALDDTAKQLVREAIRNLKTTYGDNQLPIDHPTWTGISGIKPKFEPKTALSINSNALRSDIETKQGNAGKDIKFVEEITNYIKDRDKVTSKEIIRDFKNCIDSGYDAKLFKLVLKNLANLDKPSGVWTLKNEFR